MSFDLPEPIAITLLVVDVLEELDIQYVIVGSLASAQHGVARSTLDSDLVVQLDSSQVPLLISGLQGQFYADEKMALDAVRNKRGFNLIHFDTMFKVDLFVARDEAFDRALLEHRVPRAIADNVDREFYVLSAEDTILAKLRWYRMGGEQSERQWRDVVGVVKVQGDRLDLGYLQSMAEELGVEDMLARLL